MGENRDRVLEQCNPPMELGFSLAEYHQRLQIIRDGKVVSIVERGAPIHPTTAVNQWVTHRRLTK